jgi:hypothetical protein
MRLTAEITRADLKEYVPKRKMKALINRIIRNGREKDRPSSQNDLTAAIQLLYCAYKTYKSNN